MIHFDVRGLEVLFAPRGVFCIAASRLPLRCHPPEAAMAVVAMAELAELAEAEADGGGDGVVARGGVGADDRCYGTVIMWD